MKESLGIYDSLRDASTAVRGSTFCACSGDRYDESVGGLYGPLGCVSSTIGCGFARHVSYLRVSTDCSHGLFTLFWTVHTALFTVSTNFDGDQVRKPDERVAALRAATDSATLQQSAHDCMCA